MQDLWICYINNLVKVKRLESNESRKVWGKSVRLRGNVCDVNVDWVMVYVVPASTTQNIKCPSIMTPSKVGKTTNFIFYSLTEKYSNHNIK